MSTTSLLVLGAILGLAVGSFLNVCIYRLPRHESLLWPGSHCPNCSQPLRWYHNLPVVSWLALGRRCAYCRAPIAARYPLVEIATALIWIVTIWLTPPGWLLASRLVLGTSLIVLFMIDLEHQILPNAITLPGIAVGLAFSLVAPPGPAASLLGALIGGGLLYGIALGYYVLRKEEGMGMGDVKMLAMIGAFLGWKLVLVTLVLSSFAGAVIGIGLLLSQRGGMRYALPFGTFLSLGTLVAMLVGERFVTWYAGFFPAL
jgi:leader peptidase (prepilin peptidase) / N-methyltransferase